VIEPSTRKVRRYRKVGLEKTKNSRDVEEENRPGGTERKRK
jgi:hypothetical protein